MRLWLASIVLPVAMALSCTPSRGRLLVAVSSDLPIAASAADTMWLGAVVARVGRVGSPPTEEQTFAVREMAETGTFTMPLSFAVEPTSGDATVEITVEAANRAGASLDVTSLARVRIVPGPTRVLPMFLSDACRGVPCMPDYTCDRGVCVPIPSFDTGNPDSGLELLTDAGAELRVDAGGGTDAGTVVAPSWEEQLFAPTGMDSAYFGGAVALSADGSRALVGGYLDGTTGGSDSGSAHVFVRSGTGWAHEAALINPDAAVGDHFGGAVALSADGTRALVGASQDDLASGNSAGSAHVFLRAGTSWSHEALLLAPVGALSDFFGGSVSLSADGGLALISEHGDDTAGMNAGSAHVFVRTGTSWTHEFALFAPDAMAEDFFGGAVALSGDGTRALVAAYRDDTAAGMDVGSAHVFLRSGPSWSHEDTLLAPNGVAGDLFGDSIAFSADGSLALVGAWTADTAEGADTGSAHVFARSGTSWSHGGELLAPDAMGSDAFGYAVALSGDGALALVSASRDDTDVGISAGSVHLYVRGGTSFDHHTTLLAPDSMAMDGFGESVALSADGRLALIGAQFDDTPDGNNAGSAHAFTLSP